MDRNFQKINLIHSAKPREYSSLNEKLQWFGTSLALFNLRDKDKSNFRIFIVLLKAAKQDKPLSSDEIGKQIGLSRGTIIHHINKLIESGIVTKYRNKYILRVDNLAALIEELKKDSERAFSDISEIAKELDKHLNL
jgi:predicted transcriptional regulator